MNILLWDVHQAYTAAFVQGRHTYLMPVDDARGPYGRGRSRLPDWPDTVVEVHAVELARLAVDLVVLQRPEEWELARHWLGRDIPAVYVEHTRPYGATPVTRHPLMDLDDVHVVHVTRANESLWNTGHTRTSVIERGGPGDFLDDWDRLLAAEAGAADCPSPKEPAVSAGS